MTSATPFFTPFFMFATSRGFDANDEMMGGGTSASDTFADQPRYDPRLTARPKAILDGSARAPTKLKAAKLS